MAPNGLLLASVWVNVINVTRLLFKASGAAFPLGLRSGDAAVRSGLAATLTVSAPQQSRIHQV